MPTPVVCAVICKNNLILACRRSLKKSQGGLWEFPGGKVHLGETDAQALHREIEEELGVKVDVGEFIALSRYEYDHGRIELSAYRCTIMGGDLMPIEHEEIRWMTKAEADGLEWSPADVPILQALDSGDTASL